MSESRRFLDRPSPAEELIDLGLRTIEHITDEYSIGGNPLVASLEVRHGSLDGLTGSYLLHHTKTHRNRWHSLIRPPGERISIAWLHRLGNGPGNRLTMVEARKNLPGESLRVTTMLAGVSASNRVGQLFALGDIRNVHNYMEDQGTAHFVGVGEDAIAEINTLLDNLCLELGE